jgi:hypothetical protein
MTTSALHALVALDSQVDRGVVEALLSAEPLRVLDYVDLDRANGDRRGGDVLIVAC